MARRVILVVIFDERASLGLVRLRVRRATTELEAVFEEIASKIESEKLTLAAELDAPFSEITDDDIDRLFSGEGSAADSLVVMPLTLTLSRREREQNGGTRAISER